MQTFRINKSDIRLDIKQCQNHSPLLLILCIRIKSILVVVCLPTHTPSTQTLSSQLNSSKIQRPCKLGLQEFSQTRCYHNYRCRPLCNKCEQKSATCPSISCRDLLLQHIYMPAWLLVLHSIALQLLDSMVTMLEPLPTATTLTKVNVSIFKNPI